MGERGKTPKRTEERRRTNAPDLPVVKAAGAQIVDRPAAEESWHPIARRWFESLGESGQSRFYEPSDWAVAAVVAESMSRDLKPQYVGSNPESGEPVIMAMPLKGAALAAYLKACTVLMATEGDRRRLQVELQRPQPGQPDQPNVANIDDYRSHFAG